MQEENEIIRRLAQLENKIDNQVLRQIEDLKSSADLARENNLLLGGIAAKIDNMSSILSTGFTDMKDTITKVILALIGLVAAIIGIRAVGSPFWLDVYVFVVIMSLTFVILESFRKKIMYRLLVGMSLLSYVLFSIFSISYPMSVNRPLFSYGAIISFSCGILFLALSTWKGKFK